MASVAQEDMDWWDESALDHERIIILAEIMAVTTGNTAPGDALVMAASKLKAEEYNRLLNTVIGVERLANNFSKIINDFALVDPRSGHVRLAVACTELWEEPDEVYARMNMVYHAVESDDDSVKGLVWTRVARKWDFIKAACRERSGDQRVELGFQLRKMGGPAEEIGAILVAYGRKNMKTITTRLQMSVSDEIFRAEMRGDCGATAWSRVVHETGIVFRTSQNTRPPLSGLALLPNNSFVSTFASRPELTVWDGANGNVLKTIALTAPGRHLAVSPGGSVAVSIGPEHVQVFRSETLEETRDIFGAATPERAPAVFWYDDRTLILSTASRLTVWRWDGKEWSFEKVLGPLSGIHKVMARTESSSFLWSGGIQTQLCCWDVPNGKLVSSHSVHGGTGILSMITLRSGKLVTGGNDKLIALRDPLSGAVFADLRGHQSGVAGLVELSDGTLASWEAQSAIRLWDVENNVGTCVGRMVLHLESIPNLVMCKGPGPSMILSSNSGNDIVAADINARGGTGGLPHEGAIQFLVVLKDGGIVTGGMLGEIVVWKPPVRGGVPVEEAVLSGHEPATWCGTVWGDGFATGGEEGDVAFWERSSSGEWQRREELSCERHSDWVTNMNTMPDGKTVVSTGGEDAIIWSTRDDGVWAPQVVSRGGMRLAVWSDNQMIVGGHESVWMLNVDTGAIRDAAPVPFDLDVIHLTAIGSGEGRSYIVHHLNRTLHLCRLDGTVTLHDNLAVDWAVPVGQGDKFIVGCRVSLGRLDLIDVRKMQVVRTLATIGESISDLFIDVERNMMAVLCYGNGWVVFEVDFDDWLVDESADEE